MLFAGLFRGRMTLGGRGYAPLVSWILKVLLLAARSKRGRELLFAGALAVVELARSERARTLYGRAGTAMRGRSNL